MKRICIDSIGPFEKDCNENEYIIVIIDCFTRFVGLYAAKTADAKSAARAVIAHAGVFQNPEQIVSDGGSQYVNEVIDELSDMCGFQQIVTNPYSSEENGLVERANKEVIRFLRGLIYEKPEIRGNLDLQLHLPMIQRIINSNYQSRLGCTPIDILFGGQVEGDESILLPEAEVPGDKSMPLSEYMQKLQATQQTFLDRAEKLQEMRDDWNEKVSSEEVKTVYRVGEYVYVELPKSAYGTARKEKFDVERKGPFRVTRVDEDDMYLIMNTNSGREEPHHVKRLSPAEFDEDRDDPAELARRTEMLWVIERVISHRGKFEKKKELFFKIKWMGYKEPTEELWAKVRDTEELHAYLRRKKLERWIPDKFKE